jgi:hypothetical protein
MPKTHQASQNSYFQTLISWADKFEKMSTYMNINKTGDVLNSINR